MILGYQFSPETTRLSTDVRGNLKVFQLEKDKHPKDEFQPAGYQGVFDGAQFTMIWCTQYRKEGYGSWLPIQMETNFDFNTIELVKTLCRAINNTGYPTSNTSPATILKLLSNSSQVLEVCWSKTTENWQENKAPKFAGCIDQLTQNHVRLCGSHI